MAPVSRGKGSIGEQCKTHRSGRELLPVKTLILKNTIL